MSRLSRRTLSLCLATGILVVLVAPLSVIFLRWQEVRRYDTIEGVRIRFSANRAILPRVDRAEVNLGQAINVDFIALGSAIDRNATVVFSNGTVDLRIAPLLDGKQLATLQFENCSFGGEAYRILRSFDAATVRFVNCIEASGTNLNGLGAVRELDIVGPKVPWTCCFGTQMQSIRVTDVVVTSDCWKMITKSPALADIEIQSASLSVAEMGAMSNLTTLSSLSILQSDLSPEDAKKLLAICPSLQGIVTNGFTVISDGTVVFPPSIQ